VDPAGGPVVSEATRARLAAAVERLPLRDRADYEDADRGFIARSETRQVRAADGGVVWDLDGYAFLDGPCPPTANPSLWRQGQLLAKDGLFEVVPGIYQVRGYDLSVVSFLETDTGVVVVDPLISVETAAAAWALYRTHRGDRPVVGMVYTHSHADHFGGVKGIISADDVEAGRVPVIAPAGFMAHAVAENVFAGPAMTRRAGYMYGAALTKGPAGQIGAGLGQTTSTGAVSLIPPTVDVERTGQELDLDGLRLVFQYTPGTEAPAEMNFFLPRHKALCMAENTSHTLHNVLTIRGAEVRDARAWADYLTEAIDLFGDEAEVVFASHHWPSWGRERVLEFLQLQRDLYSYLHDQTLRMINQGYVGAEIAEMMQLPPALEAAWHTHGYYGSVSHNVKGIYQRYLGWYDGNPAHLWQHPPVEAARRYVAAMGGADAAVAVARQAFDEGDYRWAAEVLDRVLFADQANAEARELQAGTFEQIAYGAENGTWRNAFLAGAHELRHGVFGTPIAATGLLADLTVDQVFASLAIRVDGPRAWDEYLSVAWTFTDLDLAYLTELRNGTLIHRRIQESPKADATLRLTRPLLIGLVTGQVDLASATSDETLQLDGDLGQLQRLLTVLAPADPAFPIVTP
jgi:alkyl sulfatase BDS1-like metallo-beta-lactamase superfamily hydrolase